MLHLPKKISNSNDFPSKTCGDRGVPQRPHTAEWSDTVSKQRHKLVLCVSLCADDVHSLGVFFLLFFVFFRCVHVRKCEFYMTNKLAKMRHLCLYDTLLAGHPLIACELTPA